MNNITSTDLPSFVKKYHLHKEHEEVYKDLCFAIKNGDSDLVKKLLQNVSDVNLHNYQLIREAGLSFNADIFDLLISKGGVLLFDEDNTLFNWAIQASNIKAINYYFDNGLHLQSEKALQNACLIGNYDVLQLLLERGEPLKYNQSNHPLLIRKIILSGQLDNLQLLIEHGIELEKYINSAITDAVIYDKHHIVVFLLDYAKEQDLTIDTQDNLLKACDFDRKDCAQSLLEYDNQCLTDEAIRISAERDDVGLVELFLHYNGNIRIAEQYGQEQVQQWIKSKTMFDQFNKDLSKDTDKKETKYKL